MKHVSKRAGRQSTRWFWVKLGGNAQAQKTTQNSSSSWDPTSQQRAASIWQAGQNAANAGYGPQATQAQNTFSAAQDAGKTGVAALGGDQTATQQLMNPYTQNVIDANNANWQKAEAQGTQQVDSAANAAGAFGGGRQGVAEGQMLANDTLGQQTQNAQLLSQGYSQAMGQANTLANLGMSGAAQNANVLSPQAYALQQQKNAFLGPQGQTTSGAQTTFGGGASGSVQF